MKSSLYPRILACAVLLATTVASAQARPADQVHTRVTGLHALGDAMKKVNDALRGGGDVQPAAMQQSSAQILKAAHDQYGWFPAGSGPQPGLKTNARPEIWSKPADFHAAQDAFAHQADAFAQAVASNNPAAIRTEARKLGGTCKACHDTFRVPQD